MKKKTEVNYRVEIEPEPPFFGWSTIEAKAVEQMKDACRTIIEQAKRHVDGAKYARMVWDVEANCSHCGRHWSEDDDLYNGGCCSRDQEDQEAREAAQAARGSDEYKDYYR